MVKQKQTEITYLTFAHSYLEMTCFIWKSVELKALMLLLISQL